MLYVLVKSGAANNFFFSVKRLLEKANTGWKFLEVEKAKNFWISILFVLEFEESFLSYY